MQTQQSTEPEERIKSNSPEMGMWSDFEFLK
jgi:hypothetical protein